MCSGLDAQHIPRQRLGNSNPINTRRQNPTGITRAFTGRKQAFHVQALHRFVTGYPQRRRGARFDTGQYRIVQRVAFDLLLERRQRFADGFDGEVRQR